jgi:outer membrane protein OmpA-like peptidoglycan-associated protein
MALNRAQRVAEEVAERGVDRARLVVVGRINGYFEVSSATGTASPNRRVELELGFLGERRGEP